MKLLFVLGTRPEIIKLQSTIQEAKRRGHQVVVAHTGQHYDFQMSGVFFGELELEEPKYFLQTGTGTHAEQLAAGAPRFQQILVDEKPDVVIVLGDTNSALLGCIVAAKMGVAVAHLESGMRSFDWTMPEEMNRRILDASSTVCFAPTPRALRQLQHEGRGQDSVLCGDTLVEVALPLSQKARQQSKILATLGLEPRRYALATIHRAENTDDPTRLASILRGLNDIGVPVIFPTHPRTRGRMEKAGLKPEDLPGIRFVEPLGYLDFLRLLSDAALAVTDSGGVQEEAAILEVPLLTARNNTEWVETIEAGRNALVGADRARIAEEARRILKAGRHATGKPLFPLGAAAAVLDHLESMHAAGTLRYRTSDFLANGVPKV